MFVDIMHLCVTGTPVYHVWVYACVCGHVHEMQLSLYVYVYPWRRKWLPTPVFLPGEFHGQKSLVGYSSWGCKELDMTERLTLLLIITTASSTRAFFRASLVAQMVKNLPAIWETWV